MAKNNSSNQDYTNNSDGWDLKGGTTKRKLTLTGADITLTGSGSNTYTYPASTDTLAGLGTAQTFTANQSIQGNLTLTTAGNGVKIKEGTNATMGTGTLSSGAATINTTKVTSSSRIFISDQGGTVTNLGSLYEDNASRVAGTSFTIKSSNILDSSNFVWLILEPS